MASRRLLFIVGSLLTIATIVHCDEEKTDSAEPEFRMEQFWECRRKSRSLGHAMNECYSKEFTPEEMNVTSQMYDNTECIKCKHFCRKQDAVFMCIRETAEALEHLSNKSRHMVPFVREIAETAISTLCDNDAELMTATSTENDTNCITSTWNECRSRLEHADDLDRSAFCEYGDLEYDPFTKEFFCQKLLDLLECGEKESGKCSTSVQGSTAKLIAKLRNLDICSKYY